MRTPSLCLVAASLLARIVGAHHDPFAGMPPHATNALVTGIMHLYNLDLNDAVRAFTLAGQLATNHPAPPLYLAFASIMHLACEGSSPERAQAVPRCARRAFAAAAHPRISPDPWSDLYAATALLFLAQHISNNGRYLDAIQVLKRALAHLDRAARSPDTAADAGVLLGAYHFFLRSTPWFLQHFASLLLLPADARYGLRALDAGVADARLFNIEALMLASVAHAWAGNHTRAEDLAATLTNRFPNNPQFSLLLQHVLLETGNPSAALTTATATIARLENSSAPLVRALLPDQHYACGLAYAALSNYHRALIHFGVAATLAAQKPRLRSWALLRQGTMHDRLGNRDAALICYRAVNAAESSPQVVRAYARQFLTQPYAGQSLE